MVDNVRHRYSLDIPMHKDCSSGEGWFFKIIPMIFLNCVQYWEKLHFKDSVQKCQSLKKKLHLRVILKTHVFEKTKKKAIFLPLIFSKLIFLKIWVCRIILFHSWGIILISTSIASSVDYTLISKQCVQRSHQSSSGTDKSNAKIAPWV